jgi:hypothetical protein
MMTSAARQLTHLAATMEHVAAAKAGLAGGPKHSRGGKPVKASKPLSRADAWEAQQRVLRAQQARMWQAHQAADPSAAVPPGSDADADRRINEIAARYDAEARQRPRIRGL